MHIAIIFLSSLLVRIYSSQVYQVSTELKNKNRKLSDISVNCKTPEPQKEQIQDGGTIYHHNSGYRSQFPRNGQQDCRGTNITQTNAHSQYPYNCMCLETHVNGIITKLPAPLHPARNPPAVYRGSLPRGTNRSRGVGW